MPLTGLATLKISLLAFTIVGVRLEESHEKYLRKWTNVRWYSTRHDDYYDLLETPGPTPPPDPYAAKFFENATEKFIGEIIFKEFFPMKLTITRNTRLQDVLRPNFEGAEAFSVFIVSEKFIGVEDWKVREQMVVNALKKDMPWDVRGLALILTSRYEYEHLPDSNTKNKMKKFAAMVHTKQLIIQSGYRNVTTTLHPMVHFSRIAELGERMYGSKGDENLEDNSKINEEERQMAWDYHEYNEERVAMNDKYYMKRLEQMRIDREKDIAERSKNDTLLREGRKLWTLTSYEKGLQEFSDEKKRFKFNLDGDFDYATTIAQFYHDQFNGEITRLRA